MTVAAHVFLTWLAAVVLLTVLHGQAKRQENVAEALKTIDGAVSCVLLLLGFWLAMAVLRGVP